MNTGGPVLRDIHLPSAAWWPPAPGWWLLAILALLLVVVGIWLVRRRARRRPLLAALREIDRLAAAFVSDGDTAALAEGASGLLRRIACRIDPAAASASGEPWRVFLHDHARDRATREALDDFLDARFRERPALDAEALLAVLPTWCRSALRDGHAPRAAARRSATPDPRTQAAPT